MLNPEDDNGNIEYKRYLINLDENRLEELATQMKWRLTEGNNEAIYYIGIDNDGSIYGLNEDEKNESIKNIIKLVEKNNAEIIKIEEMIDDSMNRSIISSGLYLKILIRTKVKIYTEIRIILLGETGTGKTTFLSNIILGKKDDKNDARIYLLNHKHELESKMTSSFNCYYKIINNIKLTFIDTPGYKDYQRTKYRILQGCNPNICLLFLNDKNEMNVFDKFILDNLNIPYIKINIFSKEKYNCKKLIDSSLLFNKIINKYRRDEIINEQIIKFNIINTYINTDIGIILSGYLVSGKIEINKNVNLEIKNDKIICIIKSIFINYESIDSYNKPGILTICIKPLNDILIKPKYGLLTNSIEEKVESIKFKYIDMNNNILMNNNYNGYINNKIVNIINIIKIDENLYIGNINNYYNDNNIIIIDTDMNKGIIKIIKD
jgi:GTPase